MCESPVFVSWGQNDPANQYILCTQNRNTYLEIDKKLLMKYCEIFTYNGFFYMIDKNKHHILICNNNHLNSNCHTILILIINVIVA